MMPFGCCKYSVFCTEKSNEVCKTCRHYRKKSYYQPGQKILETKNKEITELQKQIQKLNKKKETKKK